MIWGRDGLDYVVELFGITPRVRDVRAGRSVRIVRGGRARAVRLPELSPVVLLPNGPKGVGC
jgi:hypothetical protein